MSNTKFTPGPWEFEHRKEHLVGSNGKNVEIWGCGLINGQRTPELDANSSLIKASPNLYAMLERCSIVLQGIQYRHNTSVIEDTLDEISKELAKARGES